jgi:hypothetical protein
MHPAPRLSTALIGIALIVGGTALTTNFRGISSWHAKRAIESVSWLERPLRHIPPWKGLLRRSPDDRIRRQVLVTRIVGAAFALAGLALFLYGTFGIGHVMTN